MLVACFSSKPPSLKNDKILKIFGSILTIWLTQTPQIPLMIINFREMLHLNLHKMLHLIQSLKKKKLFRKNLLCSLKCQISNFLTRFLFNNFFISWRICVKLREHCLFSQINSLWKFEENLFINNKSKIFRLFRFYFETNCGLRCIHHKTTFFPGNRSNFFTTCTKLE